MAINNRNLDFVQPRGWIVLVNDTHVDKRAFCWQLYTLATLQTVDPTGRVMQTFLYDDHTDSEGPSSITKTRLFKYITKNRKKIS